MRFYTNQHPLHCGSDLHARTMDVCILRQDGEVGLHRHMQAVPTPFLKAITPSRDGLVVAVACLFTWYGLAALGAPEAMPFVLGHALSMKALHGGKAQNDTIDSQKMAVLLRGGRLPHASVYPAARRATRALLRRRWPLTRQRAERLAHVQHTHSQDTWPEIGQKLASKAKRDGVAARFPAPAVPQRVAVALALLADDEQRRSDVALTLVQTAQQQKAQPLSRRQAVPGLGKIVRVVWLDERHDMPRCPRGQDGVASCRRVTCAQAAAGTRSGTSGAKISKADLKWAFSAAAGLLLRTTPVGQNSLARFEPQHGTGKACTM